MFKSIILIILLILPLKLFSQSNVTTISKYGNDSISCVSNLSSMSEFAKIKVFDYALPPWREVYKICPTSSKNIYIYGVAIFKNILEKTDNPEIKQKYLDTLIIIYDDRIKYFGEEGIVSARKGLDLLSYNYENKDYIYNCLKKSVKLTGHKSEPGALVSVMQLSVLLLNKGSITKEEVYENYAEINSIFDKLLSNQNSNGNVAQSKDFIDKLISSISDCDQINTIYKAKLNSSGNTPEQIRQIIKTLELSKCAESDAYLLANSKLFEAEPLPETAAILAKLYAKQKNYPKAIEYYTLSVEKEKNQDILAQLYYEMAAIEFSALNNFQKARDNALKAAANKKNWGQPYLLIGNMYASSSETCTGNDLEKASIFWAAIDKYNQAKNIDSSLQEDVTSYINKYSLYFPSSETIFFYGYKIGDNFTVKCWINETTKVRAR